MISLSGKNRIQMNNGRCTGTWINELIDGILIN